MKKKLLILSLLLSSSSVFAETTKAIKIADELLSVDVSKINYYSAEKYSNKLIELRKEFETSKEFEDFINKKELHDLIIKLDNFKG